MDSDLIGFGVVGLLLSLARSATRKTAMALPGTAFTQQLFLACAAHDGAELDHAALVSATEDLAGMAHQC